jgi:alpha-glucan,water dikinase
MPALPESEERWEACLEALREVWASKWNVRAVLSLRQAALEHATLRMAVLVQRVVPADYAFVLHTTNPSTGDAGEIYGELVAGLGETLVGNYPGRALSFALRKDALASGDAPRVLGFPSKCVALRVAPTFIFRSDSNGEDLDGYAGAGLYDSIPVDAPSEEFVDYSTCQIVWDDAFRARLLQRICAAGAAIETALGSAQDIEGCVFGEEIHIVQTRPQV